MPDYGLYKLSNSTEVPRYPGSIVPELIKVAGVQQEKYDASVYSDELLQQALDTSQVREADMPVYKALYDEMAARMKERAAKGDYENMVRETNRDARTFAQRFAPIAENRKREQAYLEEMSKRIAAGEPADRIQRAIALSRNQDKGLSYDPVTRQYSGQFNGYTPGKALDLSDFVKKALQDIHPTTIGWDVRRDENGFYRERGGKTVRLTMEELEPFVAQYAKTSNEFQSYLQEEKLLKSGTIPSDAVLRSRLDPVEYDKYKEQATSNGYGSVSEYLKEMQAATTQNDIYSTLRSMTAKYQRNDKESVDKILGETEDTSRRRAKELEDAVVPLAAPVIVRMPGTEASTPEALSKEILNTEDSFNKAAQDYAAFMQGVTETKTSDGTTQYTKNGEDITHSVIINKALMRQAEQRVEALKQRDRETWEQASGVKNYKPSPTLIAQAKSEAEKAYQREMNRTVIQPSRGPRIPEPTMEQRREAAERVRAGVYNNVLKQDPVYRRREQILKADSQGGNMTIAAKVFNSAEANKQATNYFKNFVLNKDMAGLNAGTMGLTKVDNTPFTEDDYEQVKGEAEFAGVAVDPSDGMKLKYFYNVGKPRTNAKGQVVGNSLIVKMDALPGTRELLVNTKQFEDLELDIATQLSPLEGKDTKQVNFELIPGVNVYVERRNNTEMSNPGVAGLPYRVTYEVNGKRTVFEEADPSGVISSMMKSLKANKK